MRHVKAKSGDIPPGEPDGPAALPADDGFVVLRRLRNLVVLFLLLNVVGFCWASYERCFGPPSGAEMASIMTSYFWENVVARDGRKLEIVATSEIPAVRDRHFGEVMLLQQSTFWRWPPAGRPGLTLVLSAEGAIMASDSARHFVGVSQQRRGGERMVMEIAGDEPPRCKSIPDAEVSFLFQCRRSELSNQEEAMEVEYRRTAPPIK